MLMPPRAMRSDAEVRGSSIDQTYPYGMSGYHPSRRSPSKPQQQSDPGGGTLQSAGEAKWRVVQGALTDWPHVIRLCVILIVFSVPWDALILWVILR